MGGGTRHGINDACFKLKHPQPSIWLNQAISKVSGIRDVALMSFSAAPANSTTTWLSAVGGDSPAKDSRDRYGPRGSGQSSVRPTDIGQLQGPRIFNGSCHSYVRDQRGALGRKQQIVRGSAQMLIGLPNPDAPWSGLRTLTWKAGANSRTSRINDCQILPSPPV
jgi:hypothetical protein